MINVAGSPKRKNYGSGGLKMMGETGGILHQENCMMEEMAVAYWWSVIIHCRYMIAQKLCVSCEVSPGRLLRTTHLLSVTDGLPNIPPSAVCKMAAAENWRQHAPAVAKALYRPEMACDKTMALMKASTNRPLVEFAEIHVVPGKTANRAVVRQDKF